MKITLLIAIVVSGRSSKHAIYLLNWKDEFASLISSTTNRTGQRRIADEEN